jgi:DMSO/TMAO reductase YedYZ molybdopterin-dependent catalytic subunit
LKKTFAEIATTITIALVILSFTYNLIPPANGATADTEEEWQLTVTGLVANPMNLSWAEMVAMPKSTVNAALICVDAPTTILEQGNWTGIKLRVLLEEAEPSSAAIKVGFLAADDYSTDLTMETAMRDDVIVAYEKDGEPLNDLRLVVPGKWGYKWISQLTRIELFDYNFLGFWESKGYSDEAGPSAASRNINEIPTLTKDNRTSPSPTPPPATSPSPSPSQPPTSPAPFEQSTPTPKPSEGVSLPTKAIYAIAVVAVAVVIVALLTFVRKKRSKIES